MDGAFDSPWNDQVVVRVRVQDCCIWIGLLFVKVQ